MLEFKRLSGICHAEAYVKIMYQCFWKIIFLFLFFIYFYLFILVCHLSPLSAGFQSQTAFSPRSGGRSERNNMLERTLQRPNHNLLINDLFQCRLSFIGVINILKISVFNNKTRSISQSHYMITMDSGERAKCFSLPSLRGPE